MRFEVNSVDRILNLLELISEKAFAVSLMGIEEGAGRVYMDFRRRLRKPFRNLKAG